MYGRQDPSGQWSVYAEFTISHPGVGDPENVPITRTEQNDNSVRMTYSWNSQRNAGSNTSHTWVPPSEASSNPSASTPDMKFGDNSNYGFQKGNILFTSTPSRRPYQHFQTLNASNRLNVPHAESSGYGSNNLLSSSSSTQDGRKCRSTCNITLCNNQMSNESCPHHHCGRTQSLRCQTPSSRSDCKNAYYGCGDPWCHHLRLGDDCSMGGGRCSPVLETCEDCSSLSGGRGPHKATRSLSRELEESRRDVSVQTFEMVDKCTSPYLRVENETKRQSEKKGGKNPRKVRRRSLSSFVRGSEPIRQRSQSPSSFTPDSLESGRNQFQVPRRITRSPKLKKMPYVKAENSEPTTTASADDKSLNGSKKPRTVHIDVYCTGTEVESDSSNNDISDNDTASTPQTVFESEQVRITHKRADTNDLPINIKELEGAKGFVPTPNAYSQIQQRSLDKSDSDLDDSLSTAYPSKLSSYSTFKDFGSSISSVPMSWTNYSISSCAVPDLDCDSIANTSWKDNTYSDLDSVLQSRSSIAGTESAFFVPRKLRDRNYSIDEAPELLNVEESKSPSGVSLQQSDSFEYANSEDKLRIKMMEAMWKKVGEEKITPDRSESRYRKQEVKMNEYLQRKLKKLAKKESKESDSDDSADSGKGWTFVKIDGDKLGRDSTVKRQNKELKKIERISKEKESSAREKTSPRPSKKQLSREPSSFKANSFDQGSLSDSSRSPSCRTPSTAALIQRLSLDPTLRAPFTIAPGLYTEQRSIAKKFGPVISAFKKPGHHIGPVRNPECSCAHCLRYYESVGQRTRARSVGDPPSNNWKDVLNTL